MDRPEDDVETSRDHQRIEIVEETAEIAKVKRVVGTVRVRTVTDSVEDVVREVVERRSVHVEHVPIGRMVDTVPQTRVENGVTIMPIFEERLVVEKRLFLVEELHIHVETTSEDIELPLTLRKQRAVIEREAAEDSPLSNED